MLSNNNDTSTEVQQKMAEAMAPEVIPRDAEKPEDILAEAVSGRAYRGANGVRNFLIMEKRPVWVNRIVLLKKDFFPGYDFMVDYPGCGFVKNRKYLMPFAWIVRFVRLIRSGEHKKAVNALRAALLSKRELKTHSDRIRNMGL